MMLEHPSALLLLVLPALVLWLACRRGAALRAPTGALDWWARIAPREPAGAAWQRPPLALVLCAAALAAGALAFSGPRIARAGTATPETVVVDRSPSMYLPAGGGTRLDAALARLPERGERRWLAWMGDDWLEQTGAELPAQWRTAPWPPLSPPPFDAADRPGWVWLTDAPPEPPPERAGLVTAGGAAVPGPVAVNGDRLVEWDGERVTERPRERPSRLALAPGVGGELRSLIEVWAAERGFAVQPDTSAPVELRVSARGSATQEIELAHDGWRGRGRVDPAGALAFDENGRRLAPWLAAEGRVLVSAGPGRIDLALLELEPRAGSEAACAVSFARLLDRCAQTPPEVVPLDERAAAGEGRVALRGASTTSGSASDAWPVALLAGLAALLALGAYVSSTPP